MHTVAPQPSASLQASHAVPTPVAPARYVTIKQAAQIRPAFTEAAFRDLKFKAHDRTNSRGEVIEGNGTGPAGVWVQIGTKVLLDLDAFDDWLDSHRMTRCA